MSRSLCARSSTVVRLQVGLDGRDESQRAASGEQERWRTPLYGFLSTRWSVRWSSRRCCFRKVSQSNWSFQLWLFLASSAVHLAEAFFLDVHCKPWEWVSFVPRVVSVNLPDACLRVVSLHHQNPFLEFFRDRRIDKWLLQIKRSSLKLNPSR